MSITHSTRRSLKPLIKPLLAGGLMFSLIGLLVDFSSAQALFSDASFLANPLKPKTAADTLAKTCTGEVTETAQLSRKQLLQLLAIPERDSKSRVRQIVKAPYCELSSIQIRAGVEAVREAYPLAFDPETTLVILYENEEYAGYRFKH